MAEDAVSGGLAVDLELEGAVAEWVRREADARGTEPEELLDELLRAHAAVDGDDEEVPSPEDLASIREDLDALDREVDDLIEDVRDRVIQVKKEADAKAPADHDHPEIERSLRAAGTAEEEIERLEDRLERGFENYEEVLTYLTDQVEDLDGKATKLAGAVVNVREQVATLAENHESRRAAEELAAEANRMGVTEADCEACDASVDIGLLAEPVCPYCAETFTGVEEKSWIFGSPTLSTGDRPALESGGDSEAEHDLDALLESATVDPPSPTADAGDDAETDDRPAGDGTTEAPNDGGGTTDR